MAGTPESEALAKLLDAVRHFAEMVGQTARERSDVNLLALKAQCFDLLVEASTTSAQRLSSDTSIADPLRERVAAVLASLTAYRSAFVDVNLHLIALTEDWQCSACGRDVAKGLTVVSKAPLEAVVVCRACGAKTPLPPRAEQRLQQLFGPLASEAWNPSLNGFIVLS